MVKKILDEKLKLKKTAPRKLFFDSAEYQINDKLIEKVKSGRFFEVDKEKAPKHTEDLHFKKQVITESKESNGMVFHISLEHYTSVKDRPIDVVLKEVGIEKKAAKPPKAAKAAAHADDDDKTPPIDELVKKYVAAREKALDVPVRPPTPPPIEPQVIDDDDSSSGITVVEDNPAAAQPPAPPQKIEKYFDRGVQNHINSVSAPSANLEVIPPRISTTAPLPPQPPQPRDIKAELAAKYQTEIEKMKEEKRRIDEIEREAIEERKLLANIAANNELQLRRRQKAKKIKDGNRKRRKQMERNNIEDSDSESDDDSDDSGSGNVGNYLMFGAAAIAAILGVKMLSNNGQMPVGRAILPQGGGLSVPATF